MATSESVFEPVDVVIPHSGLAEVVVLIEWLVEDGDTVAAGTPLAVIESEKTQVEIDAPIAGRVEIVVPASDADVFVGATIGRIGR
jgi:pyruvate/2-oxoglutarate dehydrogenase complex dihydrolipoamide acyltransferase (E2) component